MSKYSFSKTVRIGTSKSEDYDIFAKIEYSADKDALSISGVEGPTRDGNCKGSCGQFIMLYKEYDERGYKTLDDIEHGNIGDDSTVRKFFDTWAKWHLNDMRAACEHQRKLGWTWATHGGEPCPTCDYKLGHEWKHEPLPFKVWAWLYRLPDTDKKPAWV